MSSRTSLDAAVGLALAQDGVLSRVQARSCGLDRWAVAHQIQTRRWSTYGDQSIAVHRLPLDFRARCRVSVWEAGQRAFLDGSSALRWRGLQNFDDGIHVIVPWPTKSRPWNGSVVHSSRLWTTEDFTVVDGLAASRPDVATVRAGIWARSDRAGATVMAMSVQQRIAPADGVLLEAKRLNRHKRRPLVLAVARDIAEGAQALSELDFTAMCRRRGLPEPARQEVRRGPRGRVYLDALWDEFDVAVEIEGAHHDAPENAVDDALRQNALVVARLGVLRIPVLALRTCPGVFMEQVEALLRASGWSAA